MVGEVVNKLGECSQGYILLKLISAVLMYQNMMNSILRRHELEEDSTAAVSLDLPFPQGTVQLVDSFLQNHKSQQHKFFTSRKFKTLEIGFRLSLVKPAKTKIQKICINHLYPYLMSIFL